MGYLIPDDWDGESYGLLVMCIPNSLGWYTSYTGAITELGHGWNWDAKTGDLLTTLDIAREANMTIQLCGFADIVSALNAIAAAVGSGGASGCCGGQTFGETEPVSGTIDGTEGTPPDGFVEPTATFDQHKCDAANLFYHGVESVLIELDAVNFESQFALGMTVITTLFSAVMVAAGGIFVAFLDYIGFIAQLILALWNGTFSIADMLAEWQANKTDIICTLYSSGTLDSKKEAYDALVDSMTLDPVEKEFLKAFATVSVLASTYYTPEEIEANWDDLLGEIDSSYLLCSVCDQGGVENPVGTVSVGYDIDDIFTDWVKFDTEFLGEGANWVILQVEGYTADPATNYLTQPCSNVPYSDTGIYWATETGEQQFAQVVYCTTSGTTVEIGPSLATSVSLSWKENAYRVTAKYNNATTVMMTLNPAIKDTPPAGYTIFPEV